jgi:hypothetical protein
MKRAGALCSSCCAAAIPRARAVRFRGSCPRISLIDQAISTDRSSETIVKGVSRGMKTTTGTEHAWVAGWRESRRGIRCR